MTAIDQFNFEVRKKGLKYSHKREDVFRAFLNAKRHLSVQELYRLVKSNDDSIGFTTVYRTLKFIENSGLAEVVDFNDGVKRYELKIGREYHAHFICTCCGNHFEVFDAKIKAMCVSLAQDKGFSPQKHRYEIFGLCKGCA